MSKLDDAAQAASAAHDTVRKRFKGLSDGLNRSSSTPGEGLLWVADGAVVVAWTKPGLRSRHSAERFEPGEILDVRESGEPLPGLVGAMERKNAERAIGRVMGNSASRPTLTLATRRGDFRLFFKPKELGELREAFVAVGDLIG